MRKTKTKIVRDTIRRFPNLQKKTIARYILNTHGDLFATETGGPDIEVIRGYVRRAFGSAGVKNRKSAIDKSLFGDHKVKMPKTWNKVNTSYKLPPGLWLVLSDIHVPHHVPMAVEAAIQAGQAEKVNGIFLNGDIQECGAISYWPTARRDFNAEMEATIDFLDFLRGEFPKQNIVYKPGNHEYRLPRLYVSKVPELAETPLAAMETVLGLESRNIEFLDYHQIVYAGKLPIIHGHEIGNITRAVNPARGLFLKAKTFAACSHCHSTSEHTPKTIEGKLLTTWSFGCLCNLEPEWRPYGNDWNWGFAIINIEKDGNFEVVNRRISPAGRVI